MKVAAVFYSLEPRGGGVHTFAGTLFDAIRAAEADSQHSFVFYSAGGATPPAGVKQIPATRVARSRKRAIDSWRGRA